MKVMLPLITAGLLAASTSCFAAIVQTDNRYLAFQAEIGTLDDGMTNGSKFDLMGPDANSMGPLLIAQSSPSEVSYEVQFSDNLDYTVYVRYRETGPTTPTLQVEFDSSIQSASLYVAPSFDFQWVHLPGVDVTPTANTPQSFTLRSLGGVDYNIDAVAFVKRSEVAGTGLVVDDAYLSTFSPIPEPSSALLLLLGGSMIGLRRRRR